MCGCANMQICRLENDPMTNDLMTIDRINYLVLKVKDIDETCNFYRDIFGMEVELISARKRALRLGDQKLTIHQKGRGFDPEAQLPASGPIDIWKNNISLFPRS